MLGILAYEAFQLGAFRNPILIRLYKGLIRGNLRSRGPGKIIGEDHREGPGKVFGDGDPP